MILDISFGLLLGKYFSITYFSGDYKIFLFGVIFSLLPDMDFVFESLYKKYRHNWLKRLTHRGLIHTPIFYSFITILLYAIDINPAIVLMFVLGITWHLMHDLFVLGRGVKVFYPFSKKSLRLFPDNGADGYLNRKVLWCENVPNEIYKNVCFKNKKLEESSWVRIWYARPNLFLFGEMILTIIFLVLFLYI